MPIIHRGAFRRLIVTSAVVLTASGSADPAFACSCASGPVQRSFKAADLVVLGRVMAIQVVDEYPGLLRVETEVIESFKSGVRSIPKVVYTQMSGASCYGYHFDVGRQYVIFASNPQNLPAAASAPLVPPNELLVSLCGGTEETGNLYGNQALNALRKIASRK